MTFVNDIAHHLFHFLDCHRLRELADVDLFLLEDVENIREGLKGNKFASADIVLTLDVQVHDFEHSSTQIVNDDVELVGATGLLLVETVGDGGGGGFVDDMEDGQTGEGTGPLEADAKRKEAGATKSLVGFLRFARFGLGGQGRIRALPRSDATSVSKEVVRQSSGRRFVLNGSDRGES